MRTSSLHAAAAALYPSLNIAQRIKATARDLKTPESTVKKWWYGKTRIPGAVEVAIRCLRRERGCND